MGNIFVALVLAAALSACTFSKNPVRPPSEISADRKPADQRCNGGVTEIWKDGGGGNVAHVMCRVGIGLIDADTVADARQGKPRQAKLAFQTGVPEGKKAPSFEAFIETCDLAKAEVLELILSGSHGASQKEVFCRFPDQSLIESRTLFFGAAAPGYRELASLLE